MNAHSNPKVAVIGAGAAGISAASWLSKLGVSCLWISNGPVGGTLTRVFNPIQDWPGVSQGTGAEAIQALLTSTPLLPQHGLVTQIAPLEQAWELTLKNGAQYTCDHVILATGTRQRDSGIEYDATLGERILYSTSRHANQFAGMRVAVVGGGDGAIEGALNLAAAGAEVDVYARSPLSARDVFLLRAESEPKIQIMTIPSVIERIVATQGGCLVVCGESAKHYAGVFLKIGVVPELPLFLGQKLRMEEGYVWVDTQQQTVLSGIWAAGDVTNVRPQSLTTACGSGVRAADAVATILRRAQ